MRKINLIFALLLSLMGVTQINAQTVTESFEDWSSSGVADGWLLINNATYGNSYSYDYVVGSSDFTANTGNNCLGNSSHSAAQGTIASPMIVTPKMTGTLTFKFRKYNSSSSTKGYINVFEYDETTGAATGSSIWTCRPNYTNEATSKYQDASITVGDSPKRYAIYLAKVSVDDFTYTPAEEAQEGPALKVTGDNNGTLDFGMVNPGTTKQLTLKNPGTESITVDITTTGGFTTDASKTIAAGGQETLEIAAPDATATGSVTITPNPAVDGINPVTITLSAVVKDPYKMFEDFSGKALPAEWTSTGSWSFTDGYAKTGNNTNLQLTTPMMVFEDGETFAFDAAGCSSWASYGAAYQGKVIVQTSTDGTNFSDLQTFSGMGLDEWQNCSVTIPAGTKFVRFVASYASIDNIYGGKLDETPRPKLEVEGIANGGSLSWGYSNVSAGTTKAITLKNDGTADLNVTIVATDDYTVDPASATIEAGGTVVVTIGTPAHDGNGVLTITPAEGSGLDPYTINLTSYYKEPKPVMSIDKTSIAFGKVNEVKSETITVSNTGDADLVATITNDNTDNFTVEPAESLTVAPGETGTITVTYNYVEGTWGTFNANVKLTPNYGGTYDVKTIAVSATSKDPNVWDEDFESGELDQDWIASGWSISTPGSYSGGNGTKMVGGNSSTATLITPRLIATEGQQLTFELGGSSSSYPLTVEYSTDRESWTEVASFTEDGTCSIDAPVTDPTTFYLRFTGWVYIDNLNGFKLDKPEHDAAITAVSIPATGNQYVEYTATVTVKELADKDENAKVEFYFGETKMGEVEGTLDPNSEETFVVTFTPEEAFEGDAHFKVTFISDDDEVFATFDSDPVAVNIAAATVFDETTEILVDETGNKASVVVKYTPKAGWNTIALPFALTNDILTQIFGEGWKAYEFNGYKDGALSFKSATMFAAGYPYVVYSAAPVASENGYVVNNVNVSAAQAKADSYGGATFQATYTPIAAPDMAGKYGVVPSTGKIQKGSDKASLKSLRGYFELPASAPANVNAIFFEEDGTITSINAVELQNEINGNLYDLSGRKVEGKAKAGVYIQNGKKVVVK